MNTREGSAETERRDLASLFGDVPFGHERAWRVKVNGVEIEDVQQVHLWLDLPELGVHREARYGMVHSEGGDYPGFFYTEGAGGGTGAVLYTVLRGELYIAVIEQERINTIYQWFMPGGYRAQNTTVQENAQTEVGEEVTNKHYRVVDLQWELAGEPGNFNRGLHATLNEGDGVNFVAFRVRPELLIPDGDGFRFQDDITEVDPGTEKVKSVKFVHWSVAACVSDMLMNAAVIRLMADMHDEGKCQVSCDY